MFRYASLLILHLALFCVAPSVHAQNVSTVSEQVKARVKEEAPCWKLFRHEARKTDQFAEIDVDWVCGKESVGVYLYEVSSEEAAAMLLREIVTSPVQSLAVAAGAPRVDSYKFGDESYVRAYLLYSKCSYIFFRQGKIVVRIDSNTMGKATSKRTLANAVRFAEWFTNQMRLHQ